MFDKDIVSGKYFLKNLQTNTKMSKRFEQIQHRGLVTCLMSYRAKI